MKFVYQFIFCFLRSFRKIKILWKFKTQWCIAYISSYIDVRIDFRNIKTVYNIKLLGIFVNIYQREGKMILSKFENEKYGLSYAKINFGQRIGFDRPIKLIEKNKNVKGRRKQNEISFRMDLITDVKTTTELQVFDSKKITKEIFEKVDNKNEIIPEYLDEFTTNFWDEF